MFPYRSPPSSCKWSGTEHTLSPSVFQKDLSRAVSFMTTPIRMCMSGWLTECDDQDDYMVVRGEDHKAGRESPEGRFKDLEKWT